MRGIFVLCLFLVNHLQAGSTNNDPYSSTSTSGVPVGGKRVFEPTTTPSLFDMDKELAEIATSCLTSREHEQLSGNILKAAYARFFNFMLIIEATKSIASTEMRAALGFAPSGPWKNYREPSEEELTSAVTIEEYFDLRERSKARSLDSDLFFEKNFPPVIAFLDKRFPAIRIIFRREFQEIIRGNLGGRLDRKRIDYIIDKYGDYIFPKILNAINAIFSRKPDCQKNF